MTINCINYQIQITTMLPDETVLLQFSKAVLSLIILELLVLASITGLFIAGSRRSLKRLHRYHPDVIKLLQGESCGAAAVIKVPDLAGDLMDIEVPLYRIEKIRRCMPDSASPEIQLWLALLVCAAYGEIKSFRDDIVNLIERERESKGLRKLDLAPLCRFSIPPYMLFRIINCIMIENAPHPCLKSLFSELKNFIESRNIRHDVALITVFRAIASSFRTLGALLAVLAVCAVLLFNFDLLPRVLVWFLLPVLTGIMLLLLMLTAGTIRKISDPLSCRDISNDLRKDIPLLVSYRR